MQPKTFKPKAVPPQQTRAQRAADFFKRHLDEGSALAKVVKDPGTCEAMYELVKLSTGEYEHDKRHDAPAPEAVDQVEVEVDHVAENEQLRAQLENEKLRAELAALKAKNAAPATSPV